MNKTLETPERIELIIIEENYRILTSYLENIKSLFETFEFSENNLRLLTKNAYKELDDFIEQYGTKKEVDGKIVISLPQDKRREFNKLNLKVCRSVKASELIPRSYIVSLISLYDAFLGNILRSIYSICPDKLNTTDMGLSFSQLSKFQTIEEARESIIEKRIENILRSSHQDQFDVLEKELDVKTLRKFDKWPLFIEITQRRNLFVHSDGRVSSQYLSICKKEDVENIDTIQKDTILVVDKEYFEKAFDVFYEIGIKLSFMVLWKLVVKKDKELSETVDGNLISVIYNLIVDKRYDIAIEISDFAFTAKYSRNQRDTLYFQLNKAQAYKWKGEKDKCAEILQNIDTSAMSPDIIIPKLVLEDRYNEAIGYMKQACRTEKKADDMDMYRNWPIFCELRKVDDFRAEFKTIYGEDLYPEKEYETSPYGESPKEIDKKIEVMKTTSDNGIKRSKKGRLKNATQK